MTLDPAVDRAGAVRAPARSQREPVRRRVRHRRRSGPAGRGALDARPRSERGARADPARDDVRRRARRRPGGALRRPPRHLAARGHLRSRPRGPSSSAIDVTTFGHIVSSAGSRTTRPRESTSLASERTHELDGARARLARRQVAGDAGSGVVLDRHAMADQIVQLRVVRHAEVPYITTVRGLAAPAAQSSAPVRSAASAAPAGANLPSRVIVYSTRSRSPPRDRVHANRRAGDADPDLAVALDRDALALDDLRGARRRSGAPSITVGRRPTSRPVAAAAAMKTSPRTDPMEAILARIRRRSGTHGR